jgi:hypothetical protein
VKHRLGIAVLLCFAAPIGVLAAHPVCAPAERQVSHGIEYQQLCRTSPEGQPWSIHVLRVSRKAHLTVHAVAAHNQPGEMVRELPTAMAMHELDRGHRLFAVVNGDFDFTKPESNMGISLGLSVADKHIWTGDQSSRPVMGFTHRGEPVIGIPSIRLEVWAGKKHIPFTALNKPVANPETDSIFTGQYRSLVALNTPAKTLLSKQVSLPTPLPLYKTITAVATETHDNANEVRVPRAGLAIVTRPSNVLPVHPGEQLKIRFDATVNGKRVRDAIGGFPILVREGKRSIEGEISESLRQRHPRTAVCYNRESVIFAVVDGRQPSLSVGMSLEELADLMIGLGCEVAMNTDGGGSSVMALKNGSATEFQVVNSPSDGKERGRGNAWVVEAN